MKKRVRRMANKKTQVEIIEALSKKRLQNKVNS
jgi:hypothetical protein